MVPKDRILYKYLKTMVIQSALYSSCRYIAAVEVYTSRQARVSWRDEAKRPSLDGRVSEWGMGMCLDPSLPALL